MLREVSSGGEQSAPNLLPAIAAQLERGGVRYCQWRIETGKTANDRAHRIPAVLVEPAAWHKCIEVLCAHGCKPVERHTRRDAPAEMGFLAFDAASGELHELTLCMRTYFGTGSSRVWAPALERALLASTEVVAGVRVPQPAARLVTIVAEAMLVAGASSASFDAPLAGEVGELLQRAGRATSLALLEDALPEITVAEFERTLNALMTPSAGRERRQCSRVFRQRLRKFRLHGWPTQLLRLLAKVRVGRGPARRPLTGGRTIALIGPQATGKSTLTRELRRWLDGSLDVYSIHAGKPPPTALTWLPVRMIPLVRRLMPERTTIKVEQQVEHDPNASFPLIFLVRKLILAYERRALLRRVYRDSRRGWIVLSDRYPSDAVGAIDGATFEDAAIDRESSELRRRLMQWERRLYAEVSPPDLVLQLTVSVEKALERNRTRNKKGNQSSEYVRLRHAMTLKPEFRRCPVLRISTDADFDETLLAVKKAVWPLL